MKLTKQEQAVFDAAVNIVTRHEHTVTNALGLYIQDMIKVANKTQSAYESVKDDPEAKQDASLITVSGLRQSALMFREAAEHAQVALDELEELSAAVEELG
jgi:hypothetical protein